MARIVHPINRRCCCVDNKTASQVGASWHGLYQADCLAKGRSWVPVVGGKLYTRRCCWRKQQRPRPWRQIQSSGAVYPRPRSIGLGTTSEETGYRVTLPQEQAHLSGRVLAGEIRAEKMGRAVATPQKGTTLTIGSIHRCRPHRCLPPCRESRLPGRLSETSQSGIPFDLDEFARLCEAA